MTELTTDYLDRLLELHPDGDIHATVLDLRAHLADLEKETDPDEATMLTQTVLDLASFLDYLLRESGRGGEDYVSEGALHTSVLHLT